MRWSLLTVRLVIVAISIITALILILTVVPLATGGLDIKVPDGQDIHWEVVGDNVSARVTVSIHNGGFFDIDDFTLSINMTDVDGTHLSTSSSAPTDLKAGEWTEVVLPVHLDLNSIPAEKRVDIVFNGTDVTLGLGLDSYFGLKLIHLSVAGAGNQTMQIPALITDLTVDPAQMRLETSGAGYAIVQPYSFGASEMITGKQLGLTVSVRNTTSQLSSASETITIQSFNSGEMTLPLSNAAAKALFTENTTLRVEVQATVEGVSFSQSTVYQWTAPITNLQIYNVQVVGSTLTVEYGFQASSMVTGQTANVAMTISDQVGVIGQGTDSFVISSNNHRTITMAVSSAAAARLASPTDLQMDADVTVSGLTVHVTKTYHWTGGA